MSGKFGALAPNWKGGWKNNLPICNVCGVRLSKKGAICCTKHAKRKDQTAEKNHMWKGDNIGYISLHTWVAKRLGKPGICENCGTKNANRYEWANLTKEYVRDLSKWTRLCSSCHIKHDRYNHKLTLAFKVQWAIKADSLTINEDNRRKLTSFPEGKLLEIKEDCVVGGHYHKIKTEYFVLVEGYAKVKLGIVTKVMRKGKLIVVPPFTNHEFEMKAGSILLGLCSHPYDKNDDYYV